MNYEKEKIKNALMFILTAWLTAMFGFTWAAWGVLERRGVFAAYSEMEGWYLAATGFACMIFAYYLLFAIPRYRRGERLEFTRVQRAFISNNNDNPALRSLQDITSIDPCVQSYTPTNIMRDS